MSGSVGREIEENLMRKVIPAPIREGYRFMRAKVLSIGLSHFENFSQTNEEIMASKDISVIVPIHDVPVITRRCLLSLQKYGAHAEVILVNDASQLEETENMISDFQQRNRWQVINHDKSLGHSRSCEHGSEVATKKYLCFLNSDTVITPWSWRGAKEAFDSDPRISVTGPTTSRAATRQAVRRAEYCRNYWTNSQIYAFAKKYISKQPPNFWIDLPVVSGFAFFIRRTIWEEFGGFDTKLPDYGNESELCKRLLANGLRIVWTKNSYIHHFGQASYSRIVSKSEIKQRSIAAEDYINSVHNNR